MKKFKILLVLNLILNYLIPNNNTSDNNSKKILDKFKKHNYEYHIKVFPACENFLAKMSPNDISRALKELVEMISYKPWFYLAQQFPIIMKNLNSEEKNQWEKNQFDGSSLLKILKRKKIYNNKQILNVKKWLNIGGGYWEFIIDQLSFYHKFLNMALVNTKTNTVFFIKNFWQTEESFHLNYQLTNIKKSEKLLTYWQKTGQTIQFDFYALYFDYSVKLFLEGILKKDIKQTTRYLIDLKEIAKKLIGSIYEYEISEHLKKYNELNDLLKLDLNIETFSKQENNTEFNELIEYLAGNDEF